MSALRAGERDGLCVLGLISMSATGAEGSVDVRLARVHKQQVL